MSHEEGAYLGGVRDIESLRQRCVIDDITGCWHWSLSIDKGAPMMHVRLRDGTRKKMRGRRGAAYLSGRDLKPGQVAYACNGCETLDCCNPNHAKVGNRSQHGKWLAGSGLARNLPSKAAASRKTWDKRGRNGQRQ